MGESSENFGNMVKLYRLAEDVMEKAEKKHEEIKEKRKAKRALRGVQKKAEPKKTYKDLLETFNQMVKDKFQIIPPLCGKDAKFSKELIDHFGYELTERVFLWTLKEWKTIQRKFRIEGLPTVGIIYGFNNYLFSEVQKQEKLSETENEF